MKQSSWNCDMPTVKLDELSLQVFSRKGQEIGGPQTGQGNGVKVRRVMQLLMDHAYGDRHQIRVLDVGCGEGVYSIEAALQGFRTVAIDARTERMKDGMACAKRNQISNIQFQQMDARDISDLPERFDFTLLLGILYHLTGKDAFSLLKNAYAMTSRAVIIDTHIATSEVEEFEFGGQCYRGSTYREHDDNDIPEVRRGRTLASLDNTFSFLFSKDSLIRALGDVGFTSISECLVPLEPTKPDNRITLIAMKSERVEISTYPWINNKEEQEIKAIMNSEV